MMGAALQVVEDATKTLGQVVVAHDAQRKPPALAVEDE
jgi:hypothetical protein